MLSFGRFNADHDELDEPPQPYRHLQDLDVAMLSLRASRGLAPGWGVEAMLPLRVVRSRIEYRDLSGAPYLPPDPDLHHRNETLAGAGDPWLAAVRGAELGGWQLGGRAGVAIPLGKTEPNPFAAGDAGVRHQHVQFGNGTWDPLLGLAARRSLGATTLDLDAFGRFTAYANARGYRAGHRFRAGADLSRPLGAQITGSLGVSWQREEAERWDGVREEEGNLGRTDVLLELGIARPVPGRGAVILSLSIPLVSDLDVGGQAEQPLVFAIGWMR
jgi:hypothetical protein